MPLEHAALRRDPTRALDRLEAEAEGLAERHGRRIAVVGQSRGGTMARGLAVRRPDLVETIEEVGARVTAAMSSGRD